MHRVYNFGAGPAMLPTEVLEQAQKEMLDWHNTGMSVMELGHRGELFKKLAEEIEQDFRELLNIPKNFHVLFLSGGSRTQFAAVPMNLAKDFVNTAYALIGHWSKVAAEEGKLYNDVKIVCDSGAQKYSMIPDQSTWDIPKNAAYLHYVDNETIHGVEFPFVPDSKGLPLVCDMSSNLLSRRIDFSKFALIYACAQKNFGPAGITIVILRDDLLKREAIRQTPSLMRYDLQVKEKSMFNTPPTYDWYLSGLVFKWIKAQGGVIEMEKRAEKRAQVLYDFIDQSNFYKNPVDPRYRSRMDVIFNLPDETRNDEFLKQAKAAGLTNLKGHRVLGGMRAALYNAMPQAGVLALIEFMTDFMKNR